MAEGLPSEVKVSMRLNISDVIMWKCAEDINKFKRWQLDTLIFFAFF